MKNLQIVLNKKTYSKAEPTVKDWLDYYEALAAYQINIEQGQAKNECAFDMVIRVIGRFFAVSKEEILSAGLSSSVIERVFKEIQASLLSGFNHQQPVELDTVMNEQWVNSIMTLAADMFFSHGVLPADFFNQPLAALNKALEFTTRKMRIEAEADAIDNSKF